ncbi:TB2/DP1, HVA22 family-domain-containing protein [Dichotomocladium elegans]|nr:TB2/DP1, HVA22 family-domain-containing protein [Dichotomocladium elegans]
MFASGIYFFVRLVLLQMYPVYACFKAIKHDDQRQFLPLLIYWITATTFLVLEYFANIAFFWVPFYPEAKLLLVLWITLPQTKGAIVLYADFIEPFLLKHEAHIDKTLVEVQDNTKKTITVYGKGFIRLIGRVVTEMLRKVSL